MSITRNMITRSKEIRMLRAVAVPVSIAALAYTVAVVGAIFLGDRADGIDGVNLFVEGLAGGSGSFLGELGFLIPLGFAFAAGMASAVNPCGFAMLPAYLGLFLGSDAREQEREKPLRQLGRAVLVGGAVTAGFVVLFGLAGIILGLGTQAIFIDILPWIGLGVGILLTAAGAWLMGGGKLYTGLAARAASHLGDPNEINVKGYFIFGISYGVASLSCTLPIFLSVVGTTLTASGILTAVGQFFLYALGMGLVIMALTLGMAFFRGAMVRGLRRALPYVQPIGAWLMVIAGAYIIFYWLTLGDLL